MINRTSVLLVALFVSLPAFADSYWTQYTCELNPPQAGAPTITIEADVDAQRAMAIRIIQHGKNDTYIPMQMVHYGNNVAAYQGQGTMAVVPSDISLHATVYLTDLSLTYDCTHLAGAH